MTVFLLPGEKYLDSLKETEIVRLKPEKDDSDTQSAVNFAIDRGAKNITIFGATGNRIDHLLANFGLLVLGRERGRRYHADRSVELHETG